MNCHTSARSHKHTCDSDCRNFKNRIQERRGNRSGLQSAILTAVLPLLLLGSGARVRAQAISVTVNGQPVQFLDIGPQQIAGRTLVPVRGVLEKLGATVAYVPQTQTVVASTAKMDIQLKIGSNIAVVNGKNVTLDVAAQEIRDHTFVPLRFLGEALGADVGWDGATRTVRIITKDALNAGNGQPVRPAVRPDRPARRPDADTGPAPVINGFAQDAPGWLRGGATLHVTLDGTPGAQADFRVPGLVEDVPMRETSRGHYVGAWQVPVDRPLQLRSAAVIGSLKVGGRPATMIQAGQALTVDAVPPTIRDTTPEEAARVNDPRPGISAVFEDEGSGIDRKSARLLLNGQDVTAQATITRDFISYRPASALSAGPQTVELRIMDIAGNRASARWTFTEQAREAGGIRSVSDNATHPLQSGDSLLVELNGSPGSRATFSAGNIQNVPLREDRPGHYTCNYTVRRGDDVADKPILFRLQTPDGQKFQQSSNNMLRINAGKPTPPLITSPGPNEAPGNPLVIRGTAAPHSRVHIRVNYSNKALGLVTLQGTAADTTVRANGNGDWQTAPINIGSILGNRGVDYTIAATAANDAGEQSAPSTARFRIR